MPFTLPQPSVPIVGGGAFPVRRIFCVGRNYRAHAIEMGHDPDREAPFFFTKPADAIVLDGGEAPYASMTAQLEHEVELALAIGGEGADVPSTDARRLIFGYAVGIDLTRRDLQAVAKKEGRPWDMAKGFDHSAPCGAITPAAQAGDLSGAAIWLTVNSKERQRSDLGQLIWSVEEVVAELSRLVRLKPGDLIYTGTPDRVGPVHRGDRLHAGVDGLAELRVRVV